MTTLRHRPEPGTGDGGEPTGLEAAHCPHCGSLMETEVRLPWPTEPALCLSCERWVGRARAIPAPAEAEAEPAPGAHEPAPASHERRAPGRRRSPRPAPAERRRARELGPPPVPRFPSPDEVANEHDTTFHDDAFAATGVWDAPGYGAAQNGVDLSEPTAPTGEHETRGVSHSVASDGGAESWTELSGEPDGNGHPPEASANGDAPISVDDPTDAERGSSSCASAGSRPSHSSATSSKRASACERRSRRQRRRAA